MIMRGVRQFINSSLRVFESSEFKEFKEFKGGNWLKSFECGGLGQFINSSLRVRGTGTVH